MKKYFDKFKNTIFFNFNVKAGFTLAEVLITISVIGIIAALTIPSLITSYQKQKTVSILKKHYSILQNAVNLALQENGNNFNFDCSDGSGNQSCTKNENIIIDSIMTKIKYTTFCNRAEINSNCPFTSLVYYGLGGTNVTVPTGSSNNLRYTLIDGTWISFQNYWWGGNTTNVYIDINGKQKPNIWGKDVFVMQLTNTGISANDTYASVCNTSAHGGLCLNKIIKDGWEILDDYPF